VAPAIYGGIQIGIHNGTRWETERVPCPPGLQCVIFIPDFIGKTSDARGVLSDTISRRDAAFNVSRVAFLVHALCMNNLDNLKWGVEDRMHQPQRGGKLYKYLFPMIKAAQDAGAVCAYLSGAGPSVMAITSGASGDIFAQREKERSDRVVAREMIRAAKENGITGRLVVTTVSFQHRRHYLSRQYIDQKHKCFILRFSVDALTNKWKTCVHFNMFCATKVWYFKSFV
jgi:homoserine kinase